MSANNKFEKIAWDQARPAPVVLISGPEEYFADQAKSQIKQKLTQADESLVISQLSADLYASGELLTLASPSLFGEPRLIIVDRVEKTNDTFLSECKEYVLNPNDETTLVLRHTSGARGRGLLETIRKSSPGALEINCPEIKPRDRAPIIRKEIKRLGGQIDNNSLTMLLEAYQTDFEELISVARQLVQLSGGYIDDKHVENITGGRVEANSFRVADAAVAGRTNEALVLLRHSLNTGTAAIPLLAAINLKIRTMAKMMGSGLSSGQGAKKFGLAPWQAERAMRDLHGWNEQGLARAVDLGAHTEMMLKGGTRSPDYALEKFVIFVSKRGK